MAIFEMRTITMPDENGNDETYEIVDKQTRENVASLSEEIANHEGDTNKHITSSERTAWNNKSNFSGSYDDLINKPMIPSNTSQLINDSGFLTQHQSLANYAKKTEIPTMTSQLTNDSGFLTSIPSEYVTDSELEAKKYATQTSLAEHTSDKVAHITAAERTMWNAKNLDKYFTSTNSNTLTWDGNTAGLANIGNADFKVYGEAPTVAEASEGGYFKWEDNGEIKTFTFTSTDISSWNDDIYAIYGDDFGEIIVVSKDGASHGSLTNLEKGIYISSYSGMYICEFTFNGYQFANQVLKGEYLPKHEHLWQDIKNPLFGEVKSGNGDTIVSDKVVYGNYHKVSDAIPTLADINKGVQLTYHGVKDGKVLKASITFDSTDQYYYISENAAGVVITYDGTPLVVISFTGSSTIGGMTFEGITEAGTYFRQDSYYCTYSLTISEYTGYPYMFEKIPERYLPEDYIKQLVVESLPEDYIKQLVEEVINAGGGTGGEDGLLDSNGNYLYDISNNRLIAKE